MCAALRNGEHWQRFKGLGTASMQWPLATTRGVLSFAMGFNRWRASPLCRQEARFMRFRACLMPLLIRWPFVSVLLRRKAWRLFLVGPLAMIVA